MLEATNVSILTAQNLSIACINLILYIIGTMHSLSVKHLVNVFLTLIYNPSLPIGFHCLSSVLSSINTFVKVSLLTLVSICGRATCDILKEACGLDIQTPCICVINPSTVNLHSYQTQYGAPVFLETIFHCFGVKLKQHQSFLRQLLVFFPFLIKPSYNCHNHPA